MPLTESEIHTRLKRIRLLLLDVDGVLTDGNVTYLDDGQETKSFNVKDGLGLRLLMDAGIGVGIVTGRRAPALIHRCNNLGIELVFDGIQDKAAALNQVVAQVGVKPEHIAFVGDDLPDLPLMTRVGLSVAVGNAVGVVLDNAHMRTTAHGGAGAVRELCEAILDAQGMWPDIVESYLA